jgi:hypothetical protein
LRRAAGGGAFLMPFNAFMGLAASAPGTQTTEVAANASSETAATVAKPREMPMTTPLFMIVSSVDWAVSES